ncbi:MAG: RNA polymerase sigma factor [Bacteroidota bacterium]
MASRSEETALIDNALSGQQPAFKQLYELHVEGLFRFLNQFASNREQTEEWTQRAFIKAFQKLASFKKEARFKTWLFTIGMNEMRTDMRKNIHFENIEETPEAHGTQEFSNEEWMTARSLIRKLPNDKKMVFLLYEVEGYSHREIGELLDIKEATSRVILNRTKAELRQGLQV